MLTTQLHLLVLTAMRGPVVRLARPVARGAIGRVSTFVSSAASGDRFNELHDANGLPNAFDEQWLDTSATDGSDAAGGDFGALPDGDAGGLADLAQSLSDLPPTDKQVQYAQRLAELLAEPLPPNALQSKEACSEFIDQMRSKAPPSEKQLDYARVLADKFGVELPDDVLTSNARASEFIDRMVRFNDTQTTYGQGGGAVGSMGNGANFAAGAVAGASAGAGLSSGIPGGPTSRQLQFMISLAQQRKIGIPAEALETKQGSSNWIDTTVKFGAGVSTEELYDADSLPAPDAPAGDSASADSEEGPKAIRDFKEANIPF